MSSDVDTGDVQPPAGAPHYRETNLLVLGGIDRQLDVLSLGHNLEHGAIIAWYDPGSVDQSTVTAMQEWSGLLDNSGFAEPLGVAWPSEDRHRDHGQDTDREAD